MNKDKAFKLNDEVYLKGSERKVFIVQKVHSVATFNSNYKYVAITHYDIKDILTGTIHRISGDDLTLKKEQDELDLQNAKDKLDKAMDIYNDLMKLHLYFKVLSGSEEKYIRKANRIMRFIKSKKLIAAS